MPPFHDRLIEVTRCRAGGMRLAAVGSALRASTFGPHAIGTERSVTVSSGTSFMLVVDAFLQKRVRVQNPDKDAVARARATVPHTGQLRFLCVGGWGPSAVEVAAAA
jgi:hypothetical protein